MADRESFVTHNECYENRKEILDRLQTTEIKVADVDKREMVTSTIVHRIDKALWIIVTAIVSQTIALLFGAITFFLK